MPLVTCPQTQGPRPPWVLSPSLTCAASSPQLAAEQAHSPAPSFHVGPQTSPQTWDLAPRSSLWDISSQEPGGTLQESVHFSNCRQPEEIGLPGAGMGLSQDLHRHEEDEEPLDMPDLKVLRPPASSQWLPEVCGLIQLGF